MPHILYFPLLILATIILMHTGTLQAAVPKTPYVVHQPAKQTNPVVTLTHDSTYLHSSISKEQVGSANLKPLASPVLGLHQAAPELPGQDAASSEEGKGPPPWVPGPPPWAGSDEDDDHAENNNEEGKGPPPWVPGPPPWAGHGQEDQYADGIRNGPPSWVPGSPPFARSGD